MALGQGRQDGQCGGTGTDHVGRFRGLAEASVAEVMVRLVDIGEGEEAIERMAAVIEAFR